MRPVPASGRAGITLIEMMVAMTIFSMVVLSMMQFADFVSRRMFAVRNEMTDLEQMVSFLRQFSDDVRQSREVLYTSPTEIGLWRIDENSDSVPDSVETIGYAWDPDGAGTVYRRAGDDSAAVLSNAKSFRLGFDEDAPRTRHVILDMSIGRSAATAHPYHFSSNIRASELR